MIPHQLVALLGSDLDVTHWTFPRQVLFNGLTAGMVYGVLAVGIVLIYRSSRVINFAYGEIATFAAVVMSRFVFNWHFAYVPALIIAVLAGAALSAVIELTVVRRLFDAPRVVLFVATLGVAQLVVLLELLFPQSTTFNFPTPFSKQFVVAGVLLSGAHIVVFAVVPIVTGALVWFLKRTRYGVAIRAAAANAGCREPRGNQPETHVDRRVDHRRRIRRADRRSPRSVSDRSRLDPGPRIGRRPHAAARSPQQ